VARVARSLPLLDTSTVDCAIAELLDDIPAEASILRLGPPGGVADAGFDAVVHKVGRTTGYTAGRVVSVDTDVALPYVDRTRVLRGLLAVAPLNRRASFAAPGDSGALVLERRTGAAVGLLIAGGARLALLCHLADVLDGLGVELAA
jgi:hypothetical protein